MKLTFLVFSVLIIGMGSIMAMLAWMLKKAIQHQDDKPEAPSIPKEHQRWIATPEEEDRMRGNE